MHKSRGELRRIRVSIAREVVCRDEAVALEGQIGKRIF